ncbi:hypothetical protein LOC71_15255 [Rhodopirellula sp. JC740]|uniref:MFS transporter n=2 Tax=Rhodopirellula halodulae TaxID=2894198 RepID=A0ABS8NL15_9BACT|nr:hypothetical protein [Rhodopirellula sp. JC740]
MSRTSTGTSLLARSVISAKRFGMNDLPDGTLAISLFSFLTAASYVVTRAVGVGLFLSRIGTDRLPYALTGAALVVIVMSAVTRMVVRRVSPRIALRFTWTVLALLSGSLAVMIRWSPDSLLWLGVLFVLAEVRGCLNSVYVTTLSNDAFGGWGSKRPFVWVATGATLAGVLIGGVLSVEASSVAGETFLLVAVGLDVLAITVIRWLPRSTVCIDTMSAGDGSHKRTESMRRRYQRVRHYRWALGALMASQVVALTFMGYQWNVVVTKYHAGYEQGIIAYFAAFYAINDAVILLLQITAAGHLLDRLGIGWVLLLYPLALLGVALAMLASPQIAYLFIVVSIGSGLNVVRRSLHDPGLASAYSIMRQDVRRETIVVVRGMVKPFVEAASAILLLWLAPLLSLSNVTLVWILVLTPWLVCAIVVVSIHHTGQPDVVARTHDEHGLGLAAG